jgi:hypothetical protein
MMGSPLAIVPIGEVLGGFKAGLELGDLRRSWKSVREN